MCAFRKIRFYSLMKLIASHLSKYVIYRIIKKNYFFQSFFMEWPFTFRLIFGIIPIWWTKNGYEEGITEYSRWSNEWAKMNRVKQRLEYMCNVHRYLQRKIMLEKHILAKQFQYRKEYTKSNFGYILDFTTPKFTICSNHSSIR